MAVYSDAIATRLIIFMAALVLRTASAQCTFQCDAGPEPPTPSTVPPNCNLQCNCSGKVDYLCLRYTGDAPAPTSVPVIGKAAGTNWDFDVTRNLEENGEFCISGADQDVSTSDGTLGPEIFVGGEEQVVTTRCGSPPGPGFQYGDWYVVNGTSKTGGDLACDLCCNTENDCPVFCDSYEAESCPDLEEEQCDCEIPVAGDGEVVVKLYGPDGCPAYPLTGADTKLLVSWGLAGGPAIDTCCKRKHGVLVSTTGTTIEKVCVIYNQYESFFIDVTPETKEITFFLHEFCVELSSSGGRPCLNANEDGTTNKTCGESWGASSYVPTYTGIATGWGSPQPGTNKVCELTLEHGAGSAMSPPPYDASYPPEGPPEVQLVYYLSRTNPQGKVHYQQSLKESTAWVAKDSTGDVIGCSSYPPRGTTTAKQSLVPVDFAVTGSPCSPSSSCYNVNYPVNNNGVAVNGISYYQWWADMFSNSGCCSRTRVKNLDRVGIFTDLSGEMSTEFLPSLPPTGSKYRDEANGDFRREDTGTQFGFMDWNNRIAEQHDTTKNYYFQNDRLVDIEVISLNITIVDALACSKVQVRVKSNPEPGGCCKFPYADAEINVGEGETTVLIPILKGGLLDVEFYGPSYHVYGNPPPLYCIQTMIDASMDASILDVECSTTNSSLRLC